MRSIILTAAMIMIAALAAPKFLDSLVESRSEAAAEERSNRTSGRSGDVEIRAESNGHFYVDLKVDGRNVEAMVDTGASFIALRESDARRAGIRVRRSDFNRPMSTANGTSYAASVTLRRVSIDNIELRNVSAVVVPDEQLDISLLGASFLNELQRFEVADNILVMEN